MKPNYGIIRSQQMTQMGRQQVQQLTHRTRAAAGHYYYKTRRDLMVKQGTCLMCEGSGSRFLFFTCSTCNGAGRVSYCQACNGKGRGWLFSCRHCSGTGKAGF